MSIPFIKVQGAGNDFVLIDAMGENADRAEFDWPALAPRICNRHIGVGADGILIARNSDIAPAQMVIVNADGSDGDMCGNGLRCFVKYLIERRGIMPADDVLSVETGAGVLDSYVSGSGDDGVESVTVDMGVPRVAPEEIPVRHEGEGPVLRHVLDYHMGPIELTCVSMGNPHAVWFRDEDPQDLDDFRLEDYGPLIETWPDFPKKTNVEIVNVLSPDHLKMRVWERGVGLTQACGTGACAVMVAARLRGYVGDEATVSMPGGDVQVFWEGPDDRENTVFMTGPASFSFEGHLDSNLLSVG